MPTVDEVIVELRAKTSQYEASMGRAKKSSDATSKAIKSLAAIAATALTGRMIMSVVDAGDKIQKLSVRLGATTEGLSELKFAADIAGISFETMTMALQRSTRRIAEAANGTGEAKDALRELGLNAGELNKMRPEDQLEAIADAFQGVGNRADKVRLAMKLFDSEGVSMIQMLDGGSAGLREMREEAAALGLTLSQDAADSMARAKDEMTRFSAATDGLKQSIALALLPAINDLLTGINQLFSSSANTSRIFNEMALGFAGMANMIGVISDDQLDFMSDEALERIKQGEESLKRISDSRNASGGGTIIDPKATDEADKNIKKLQTSIAKMYRTAKDNQLKASMTEAEKAAYDVDVAVRELTLTYGQLTPRQQEVIEKIKDMNAEVADQEDKMERAKELSQEMSQAFGAAFEEGIMGAESFGDVLNELLTQIQRIAIKQLVTDPFTDAAGGLLDGIFGGGGGVGDIFGDIFRAGGGSVTAGRPYVVGEKEPELFIPRQSGTIMNGAQLSSAMGASSGGASGGVMVNQSISINAGVQGTVRQEIAQFLPEFKRLSVDAVTEATRRGQM